METISVKKKTASAEVIQANDVSIFEMTEVNPPVYGPKEVNENAGVLALANNKEKENEVSTENVVFENEETIESIVAGIEEGQGIEGFNIFETEAELDVEEIIFEKGRLEEGEVLAGSGLDFVPKKWQTVISNREVESVRYFLLDSNGEKISKKGYPTVGRLLVDYGLNKESKIAELKANMDTLRIAVLEEKKVFMKTKFSSKNKGRKADKVLTNTTLSKTFNNTLVLDHDAMLEFTSFNKTQVMSMANITVQTLINAYSEMKVSGNKTFDIKDEAQLRTLGLKSYRNDIGMAKLFVESKIDRTLETHTKTLAANGATRKIWTEMKDGKFGDSEMVCFTMTSDNIEVQKIKETDVNGNIVRDEETGLAKEEYSLDLLAPVLDENGLPVVKKNGQIETQVAIPATELYDFLDAITYKGKKLNFAIQSSSQDRLGSGFYAVATNNETELERFVNTYSNGFYENMKNKGEMVAKKEIKRIAQDSSSSRTLVTKEQYAKLRTLIIPNKVFTLKEKVIDVIDGEIKVVTREIERMIGDGQGFMTPEVACIAARNAGDITPEDFNKLEYVEFNLEHRAVSKIVSKVKMLHQIRAAKGILVCTDKKEMNRLVRLGFTAEELAEVNGGIVPDFSKDFDIVYTSSMIKGGITVDRLSTLGHSKSSLEGTAKWSKMNPSFLMSYGATNKAQQVADVVTQAIADKLEDLKAGYTELSKAYDIQSDANALVHKMALLQVAGLSNDPVQLLKAAQQDIENLIKKGISVELPGIQYNFIIDDVYATLSNGKEWTAETKVTEVSDGVFTIEGSIITRKGGKVTVLRNPHNGFNSVVCRESLKASEALTGNKAWMVRLFNQNITMLSPDAIVYYLDGADFDGDKVMLIYAEDYPCFYVEKEDFIPAAQPWLYPIYVENGIGSVNKEEKVEFTIANIHNTIKKSIAIKNNVGLISERVTTLNEIRDIMLKNCKDISKDKSVADEVRKARLTRAVSELKAVVKLSVLGNAYNQAEIDKNLQYEMFREFYDTASKTVMYNGNKLEVVGLEYRGKTRNGVLELDICQSVVANVYKRVEGAVQDVAIALCNNLENVVNKIMTGAETVFGMTLEDAGLNNDLKDIKNIDMKSYNELKVFSILSAKYNMELHDIIKHVEETTKGDSDSYRKEIKKETASLTEKYTAELGDMIKDGKLAYAGLVNVMARVNKKLDARTTNKDLRLDDRKVNRLKKYKPEGLLPGQFGKGDSAVVVDGLELMKYLTSGTSFLYNVMGQGLINLVPFIELSVPQDTDSVLVNENNKMFLIGDDKVDLFETAMSFVKSNDGVDTTIIDLKPGRYKVEDGKVKIAKLMYATSGFTYRADKKIASGTYNVEITEDTNDKYSKVVSFKDLASNKTVFNAEGLLVNVLARDIVETIAKKNGLYKVYVDVVNDVRFKIAGTKEERTEEVITVTKKSEERAEELRSGVSEYREALEVAVEECDEVDDMTMDEYEAMLDGYGMSNQEMVTLSEAITVTKKVSDVTELVANETILGEVAEANELTEEEIKVGLALVSDQDLFNVCAFVVDNAGVEVADMMSEMTTIIDVLSNRKANLKDKYVKAVKSFRSELVDADMEVPAKELYAIVTDCMVELQKRNTTLEFNQANIFDSMEEVLAVF